MLKPPSASACSIPNGRGTVRISNYKHKRHKMMYQIALLLWQMCMIVPAITAVCSDVVQVRGPTYKSDKVKVFSDPYAAFELVGVDLFEVRFFSSLPITCPHSLGF